MIRRVCTYCRQDLGYSKDANPAVRVSHGICISCFRRKFSQYISSIEDFLDTIDYPVVAVDRDTTVLYANAGARQLLGKKVNEIEGLLGGEVMECLHAKNPGGCGSTVHCKSCVIRSAIDETAKTGQPQQQIPAVMDLAHISGDRTVRYLVSTEIVDNLIFLRIDDCSSDAIAS